MPYATGPDFVARYDVRLIGDLVSDTGAPVAAPDVPTNSNLLAAIADASATVDAAVFVGNRYTPAQMAALSDTAASFVRRLVCDLAVIYLKRRRGKFDAEKDAALLKEVNATLDGLREGKDYLMLAVDTQAQGSMLELAGPSLVTVPQPNSIVNMTNNYFPRGRMRLPFRNGGPNGCQNH